MSERRASPGTKKPAVDSTEGMDHARTSAGIDIKEDEVPFARRAREVGKVFRGGKRDGVFTFFFLCIIVLCSLLYRYIGVGGGYIAHAHTHDGSALIELFCPTSSLHVFVHTSFIPQTHTYI